MRFRSTPPVALTGLGTETILLVATRGDTLDRVPLCDSTASRTLPDPELIQRHPRYRGRQRHSSSEGRHDGRKVPDQVVLDCTT